MTDLQKTALKLYTEYQAIYCILNFMTIEIKENIKKTEKSIIKLRNTELIEFINKLKNETTRLREYYGAKVPNSIFIELYKRAEESIDGIMYLFPKYFLKRLFSHYDKIIANFDKLPEHVRVGIDAGTYREQSGIVELYLIEATLFEDMCSVFNLAIDYSKDLNYKKSSKKKIKIYDSLARATITGSYYFIESYLNGIAFDYFINNEPKLNEKTKSILTEWDESRNREKYLSLRDKLLQYPRIILGEEYPPFQESNCSEMSYLLERAKILRDSIVHASPKPNFSTFVPDKEALFFNTDFDEVIRVVDNSLNLVEKIENKLYGNCDRLWWFYKRSKNGYFPDEVFN